MQIARRPSKRQFGGIARIGPKRSLGFVDRREQQQWLVDTAALCPEELSPGRDRIALLGLLPVVTIHAGLD